MRRLLYLRKALQSIVTAFALYCGKRWMHESRLERLQRNFPFYKFGYNKFAHYITTTAVHCFIDKVVQTQRISQTKYYMIFSFTHLFFY